jgi:hypothetical protein
MQSNRCTANPAFKSGNIARRLNFCWRLIGMKLAAGDFLSMMNYHMINRASINNVKGKEELRLVI